MDGNYSRLVKDKKIGASYPEMVEFQGGAPALNPERVGFGGRGSYAAILNIECSEGTPKKIISDPNQDPYSLKLDCFGGDGDPGMSIFQGSMS